MYNNKTQKDDIREFLNISKIKYIASSKERKSYIELYLKSNYNGYIMLHTDHQTIRLHVLTFYFTRTWISFQVFLHTSSLNDGGMSHKLCSVYIRIHILNCGNVQQFYIWLPAMCNKDLMDPSFCLLWHSRHTLVNYSCTIEHLASFVEETFL